MPFRPLALLALTAAAATTSSPGDWKPEVERDGVRVWSRAVAGCAVHEVRAVATFSQPAERIFAMLGDVESYPRFMPLTAEARLLRRDGETAWYYMVIEPPWLSRRDYCIRITRSRLPDGRMRSEWAIDGDGCPPPRDETVRIVRNEGYWLLSPLEGGETEVTYQALTDVGGVVPTWMVNHGTPRSLIAVFTALREACTLPKYGG